MKTLTRDELRSLAQGREKPCFSFYLNTAKAGKESLENPIRFKSLLRQAHDRLSRAGVKRSKADKLLGPAVELLDDYPFWQDQDRGLAVFLSDGWLGAYKIPYDVTPLAVDGARFHLKPLLPLFAYDGGYFILSLAKKSVTLYRASRYTIEKIPLKGVPQTEAEALQYDEPEKNLQVHAGKPGSHGEQTAVVHGQGTIKEEAKERTLHFFHKVNRGVHPYLRDERAPLLLAGVEDYLPIYRKANTYPYLVEDVIAGNPESRTADELREAAWKKLEPVFKQARMQAAAAIEAGLTREEATNDLEKAVIAASHGRVDKCLVSLNQHCWGTVDEDNARVAKLEREDSRSLDLLDYAAVQTVLHGGDVFPMRNGDRMPGKSPLSVLYRF
jgi:hypothetical protein